MIYLSSLSKAFSPGLRIGYMVADAELILKGLPPVVCRKAQRETVARFRSKPVTMT